MILESDGRNGLECGKQKHFAARLIESAKRDDQISAIRENIDLMSREFSVLEIVQVVGFCQQKCAWNPRLEMRLLIPFASWLANFEPLACAPVVERLSTLVSDQRVNLSASVFAMQALFHCNVGDFPRATQAINRGFSWLDKYQTCDSAQMVQTSVLVCNRAGRHDLALRYAHLYRKNAQHTAGAYGAEMSRLMFVNSTRLAMRGRMGTAFEFKQSIDRIEQGQSKLALVNQRQLPVYAAAAELNSHRPDLARARRMLGFARELGIHDCSGYVRRSYYVASSRLQLLQRQTTQSMDALLQSRLCSGIFDFGYFSEERLLSLALGVNPAGAVNDPAELDKGVWGVMEQRITRSGADESAGIRVR